jgi:hypothetical protein
MDPVAKGLQDSEHFVGGGTWLTEWVGASEVFTEKQRNTPSLQGLSRIVMRSSAYTPPT